MKFNTKETLILLAGDLSCFALSLYLSFLIRYWGDVPNVSSLVPVTTWGVLFGASVLSFFVAGLYEKHTLVFESRLPPLLLKAQIGNAIIVVATFYFLPLFGIAPKTILFIYLVTSSFLVFLWRLRGRKIFAHRKRGRAVLMGGGEIHELAREVNGNARYPFIFESVTDLAALKPEDVEKQVSEAVKSPIFLVVADLNHPVVKSLSQQLDYLSSEGTIVADFGEVYEDVFDRVPLSSIKQEWFIEYGGREAHVAYDILKRVMDLTIAAIVSFVAFPIYMVAVLFLKLSSPGPIFISQERVGENNKTFHLIKFRSWLFDDHGDQELHKKNSITPVGMVLRKTRVDELPQLINVFRGELSFIGPRPEVPKLIEVYEKELPYYRIRHLIKPGLSGWAQINDYDVPRGTPDVNKTKRKLSYDLYYLKRRSLLLDLKIALKTLKTLLSRSGA